MRIVLIRSSDVIGTKLANRLHQQGHLVVSTSSNPGIKTLTDEELANALARAQVVVDVANSPSFEDMAVLELFETSGGNVLAAEAAAGVEHHVALSLVGIEHFPENGHCRAKMVQEELIKASNIPYTIVRSTQFFETVDGIAQSGTEGKFVRASPALFQPIGSDDVADALAKITVGVPINGTVEIAGPERVPIDELVRQYLHTTKDPRTVIPDVHARFFGAELNDRSLTPGDDPRIGPTCFEDWLSTVIQTNDHSEG
ncbi:MULTISPECIES: SDR family oxidoreductase [Phyllobacterium]|uniref:NmrA family transcriptional regulator n=1 Tax=Phyllobacterium sophorae TaxID=1520277 RepID=A0A2P7BJ79_9HYPH|nr:MULTISPECIES: NAD(P)H-binding protein [Phyllobacterium]PSH66492.1 NmrA family transcriptional regulator [Phyllobacterium sophorae]UXN64242.1 NAD(P)H-binding protein [Phyllobacterium sp. A18/5-2]